MKKILHIISSPKKNESRSRRMSDYLVSHLKKHYPDVSVDTIELFVEKLPAITPEAVSGKMTLLAGKELDATQNTAWKEILGHIERFTAADIYVISTPMWNFSIPYILKHYIDVILQPKYLFRYTASGPEGLLKNKKMYVVTSRGGDYTKGTPGEKFDLQEPYLRTVFGFAGITDITFIYAQPTDAGGPQACEQKIQDAMKEIDGMML